MRRRTVSSPMIFTSTFCPGANDLLAGVPCDFRLDYGKHVRRSASLVAASSRSKRALFAASSAAGPAYLAE